MCGAHDADGPPAAPPWGGEARRPGGGDDGFPWSAGVCDAHCHPTDTMASVALIPSMRARRLTVMATRAQDQDLVASLAAAGGAAARKVVPAFGWHPWFSHQLYDDTGTGPGPGPGGGEAGAVDKAAHYAAVLAPPPPADFLAGLPAPRPLSAFLAATRARLAAHPAALVGEVGIDKAFRLPRAWADAGARDPGLTPGGREGRALSPHRVRVAHQAAVLRAQLALAGEMGRAVSVHGVQAHGILYDVLRGTWEGHERPVPTARDRRRVAPGVDEDFSSPSPSSSSSSSEGEEDEEDEEDEEQAGGGGATQGEEAGQEEGGGKGRRRRKRRRRPAPAPYPPRICLHSFSGPVEVLRQYAGDRRVPAKVYFSFSACVNLAGPGGEARTREVIRACPDDRLLVESDLHTAGGRMDGLLEDMYRRACEVKGWGLREGVERIRRNYDEFIRG